MSTVSPVSGVSASTATLVTASVASGSAVSLSTGATSNITSISLPVGEWDVTGVVQYTPGATTSVTQLTQGSSSTSATVGAQGTFSKWVTAANVLTAIDPAMPIPVTRFSLISTTTIYLVANATFSISTLTAYGVIRALRIR